MEELIFGLLVLSSTFKKRFSSIKQYISSLQFRSFFFLPWFLQLFKNVNSASKITDINSFVHKKTFWSFCWGLLKCAFSYGGKMFIYYYRTHSLKKLSCSSFHYPELEILCEFISLILMHNGLMIHTSYWKISTYKSSSRFGIERS